MPASIGVNLRVTGHCSQGGRKYMEDLFSVAYQQTEDERDLEYAFFGIYDGHGGSEAAAFAKEHLMDSIVKQRQFWSDNDEDVLKAIRNGYMMTHLNMWKELEKWPKTVTGLPSTAGTTASVAFIRRGKIYIGHVGDSAIVLGYQKDDSDEWAAKALTADHKPESTAEIERIQRCGGKVVAKAGVPRVVWNRPRLGHKGPIKKNTPMDEIPFLAVARSLGDLWSYNPHNDEFIVSPDPDVGVLTIDPTKFRCLIFGTDGLWNMITADGAVALVQATERHNEAALVGGGAQPRDWLNPSKSLVDHALERWSTTRMRADNTSVVTLMLDPPGPPRATVLRSRSAHRPTPAPVPAPARPERTERADRPERDDRHLPQNGLTIMTRYSDVDRPGPPAAPAGPAAPAPAPDAPDRTPLPPCATLDGRFSIGPQDDAPKPEEAEDADAITNYGNPQESYFMARVLNRSRVVNTLSDVFEQGESAASRAGSEARASPPPATELPDLGDAAADAPAPPAAPAGDDGDAPPRAEPEKDGGIQINEVSSSSPVEAPPRARGRRPRSEARREPAPAPPDRVLRSHDADAPQRPQTRQAATRGAARAPPAAPAAPAPTAAVAAPATAAAPALERVVILSRRPERPAPRRAPEPPEPPAAATRSHQPPAAVAAAGAALAQKITRSITSVARAVGGGRAGNAARAPGPTRRAPAARREPSLGCKENLAGGRRRARAPAPAPGPAAADARPRPRRAPSAEPEVHSTTPCGPPPPPPPVEPPRPRALRSRNDAEQPALAGGKRPRPAEPAPAAGTAGTAKAPKLGAERCVRALGKRASGPWAPALALRNRLRRRLAK